jgi:hypothetical protein
MNGEPSLQRLIPLYYIGPIPTRVAISTSQLNPILDVNPPIGLTEN